MRSYNELGIDGSLDWPCIRKLMVIGLLAGCMVMASDTPLGWGTRDSSEAGLEPFLSCYGGTLQGDKHLCRDCFK